jgi:hypothetical protein
MITTAAAMQAILLSNLENATDGAAFRRIWDDQITLTEPDRLTGRPTPGFPDDSAPGTYWDGHLLMTQARDGSRSYITADQMTAREVDGELRFHQLWTEAFESKQREDEFVAKAAHQVAEQGRRGRPEIGKAYDVRLPDWRIKTIDQYAERHDLKRAEVIRRAIDAGMKVLRAEEGRAADS